MGEANIQVWAMLDIKAIRSSYGSSQRRQKPEDQEDLTGLAAFANAINFFGSISKILDLSVALSCVLELGPLLVVAQVFLEVDVNPLRTVREYRFPFPIHRGPFPTTIQSFGRA